MRGQCSGELKGDKAETMTFGLPEATEDGDGCLCIWEAFACASASIRSMTMGGGGGAGMPSATERK